MAFNGEARGARRWLLGGLAVVLIVFGLPYAWYHLSVEPGASIAKWVFDGGREHGSVAQAVAAGELVRDGVRMQRIELSVEGAPDAALDVYTPEHPKRALPIVLWVHGGGFIAGDSLSVSYLAKHLAKKGYLVASLDYSLAPQHRYPVPVLQGSAALAWLTAHAASLGGDPARIALGGDSAGAQIAGQLAAMQTMPGAAEQLGLEPVVQPGALRAVVLYAGFYDMRTVGSTGFPGLRTLLWSYTGYRDWLDAPWIDQLSVTEQLGRGFPPMLVSVGDVDPFAPESTRLVKAAKAKGIPVQTDFWKRAGLGHAYQFNYRLPEARETFTTTVAFLKERL